LAAKKLHQAQIHLCRFPRLYLLDTLSGPWIFTNTH
jgi:hypothetical protein